MQNSIPSRETILALIADEARIDAAGLTPSATLASLGIASLDVVTILFEIEDRFGAEIAVEDVQEARTLDAFVDIVMGKVATA